MSSDRGNVRAPFIVDALGVTVAVTGLEPSALSGFVPSTATVDVSAEAADPLTAVTEFTRVTLEHTRLLCIHAGVVHSKGGAIAFPGRSGLGKSTLTAALVRDGFGYMSDEVLAVQDDGLVRSFPRPVTLNATSRGLLTIPGFENAEEALVPIGSLGTLGPPTAKLAHVVLLDRRPAGGSSAIPAERSDAVASLVENSFNIWRDARARLSLVVGLVATAGVWRATYSDASDLARVMHHALRNPDD